jgi:hypothetical protein
MSEERHFHRIPFETRARVSLAGQEYACDLVDISLRGALFRAIDELPLKPGACCELSIFLTSTDLTLEFDGELVHQQGVDYGFRFVSEDTTTIAHLRRLLELNLGDSREIDEEFRYWLKL